MSTEVSMASPISIQREPEAVEPEDHSVTYRIGPGGISFFLSVCVVCLTAFYILVGMGMVDINVIRSNR